MNGGNEGVRNGFHTWYRKIRLSTMLAICLAAYWFVQRSKKTVHRISSSSRIHRQHVRDELVHQLINDKRGRYLIRMLQGSFEGLCELLQNVGGLRPTKFSTVEEQIVKFLYMLAYGVSTREMSFLFRRSSETISRHFHTVLRAVISLEDLFIRQQDGSHIPEEIKNDERFYPYFKDCIGAIDGTHVRVMVSNEDAPRFRGRKGVPTQNILAACSFNLKFTYVLPGWEGTASDSRIIKNALKRKDRLIIPHGKYYLADGGYMLRSGLLTPYRGERYHLKEYSSTNPPRNPRELFNLRHAMSRNAIERAFGVVKKRFNIIGSNAEPVYTSDTMSDIVLACCIIHNYLMGVDPDEELIAEVDEELSNRPIQRADISATNEVMDLDEDASLGENLRDSIAAEMWHDYVKNII